MEIRSFLLPKDKVAYLTTTQSMTEALELLEASQYSAVPVIDTDGKYIGTLSEGDLLWKLKFTSGLNFDNMGEIPVSGIKKEFTTNASLLTPIWKTC